MSQNQSTSPGIVKHFLPSNTKLIYVLIHGLHRVLLNTSLCSAPVKSNRSIDLKFSAYVNPQTEHFKVLWGPVGSLCYLSGLSNQKNQPTFSSGH